MPLSHDLIESPLAAEPAPGGETPSPPSGQGAVLKPRRNVWRIARADRASVLVDGAAYFGALREAMREARETIHIAGWDLDSRMKLVARPAAPTTDCPKRWRLSFPPLSRATRACASACYCGTIR